MIKEIETFDNKHQNFNLFYKYNKLFQTERGEECKYRKNIKGGKNE